jgi:hypothetical protein
MGNNPPSCPNNETFNDKKSVYEDESPFIVACEHNIKYHGDILHDCQRAPRNTDIQTVWKYYCQNGYLTEDNRRYNQCAKFLNGRDRVMNR